MRSETEMMALLLDTARQDERIRGMYMTGSRMNKNAPRDLFQDYDVVYLVKSTAPFMEEGWEGRFGAPLYMQQPEKMDLLRGLSPKTEESWGWLIQFSDGNRLDLHVQTLPCCLRELSKDSLCRVFLDKDGAFPALCPPSDVSHATGAPSEAEFFCCCNEFWWLQNNIGKGIFRGEPSYVLDMMGFYARPQLLKMLTFRAGAETGFPVAAGKAGKYLPSLLPAPVFQRYLSTYCGPGEEEMKKAALCACALFEESAEIVGQKLKFCYNRQEAAASEGFLRRTLALPKTAKEI